MSNLNVTERIARFAFSTHYDSIGSDLKAQLKNHLLDAVGSMLYAVRTPTVDKMFRQVAYLQPSGPVPVPVVGSTGIDRAAQLYTLLVRYPDFMDNYLGKHATCHPSDNIGAILAACHALNLTGQEFLTTMAISYQLECTLIDQMPVMAKGIDHTALLAISLTAALAPLYGLTLEQAAHAIGINGSTFNTTVTTRASYTYEWKGYASSLVALGCTNTLLLAKEGVTGPVKYFEGPMGFEDEFDMEPAFQCAPGDLSRIQKCMLKSYNAEVHTQSSIEAILELRDEYHINAADVEWIKVVIFETAYKIVGGGKYGNRKDVRTKEQADHSLPYLVAVALLDGEVLPGQLLPDRIRKTDVQELLENVYIEASAAFTVSYPEKMPVEVTVLLKDGRSFTKKKEDYKGFYTRPLTWEDTVQKFRLLDGRGRNEIIQVIENIEHAPITALTQLLGQL